jgi:hypothetical protein
MEVKRIQFSDFIYNAITISGRRESAFFGFLSLEEI